MFLKLKNVDFLVQKLSKTKSVQKVTHFYEFSRTQNVTLFWSPTVGEHLLCFNSVLLAIIVCELSFSGKIEDVTTTIIGDDLLRHFWTLVHTAEIRMANIDNFLTQRAMISKSSPTFGSLKISFSSSQTP